MTRLHLFCLLLLNGRAVESFTRSVQSRAGNKGTALHGVRSAVRRVRDSVLSRERTDKDLKDGIAFFYDRSSKLWEDVWGEHMHHGYYIPEDRTDHVQAQIDLIDEVLKWAGVDEGIPPRRVVDVGCGIGGSSRHIVRKYEGSTARGITLSPYQANRGNELAKEQNVSDRASFQAADALNMPFEDSAFDLVWSLESGEHMPDKKKFVNELMRVVAPGGRIIIVTWCHRDLERGEPSLSRKEEKILAKINRAYYLPKWCSVDDYVKLLEKEGAVNIKREDWSYIIAPFWKAVIKSSLNWKSVVGLMKSGFSTIRGAYAMLLMLRGFNSGVIKFGLITCTKKIIAEKENELAQLHHASADATRQKEVLEFLASVELEIEGTIKAAIQRVESDATASIERAKVEMDEQLRQREEEIFFAARSLIEEEWSAREDTLRGKFQAVLSSELEIQHDNLVSQYEAIVQQKDMAMKADEAEIKHRIREIEDEHQRKMGEMHQQLEEVAREIWNEACAEFGTAADARIAHSLAIADAQCTARDEQISALLEERVGLQNLLSEKDVLIVNSNRELSEIENAASNRRMLQDEEISAIINEARNLAIDHDQMKKACHQRKSDNDLLRSELSESKMECKALREKCRDQSYKVESFDYEKQRYESRVGELSACKQLVDRQMEDLKQENKALTIASEGLNKRIVELVRSNEEFSDKINVLTNHDGELQQKHNELERKHNAAIEQISSLEQERRGYTRLIEDGMRQNSKLLSETLEQNRSKSMSEPMVVHLLGNMGDDANMNERLSKECHSLRSKVLQLSRENLLLQMKKGGQMHQNDSKHHFSRDGVEVEPQTDVLRQENNSLKTILSMMRKEMETAGEKKDPEGNGKSLTPSHLTLEQQLTQCRSYLDILLKTRDANDCHGHGFIEDEVEFLRSKYRDLHRTTDALRDENARLHNLYNRGSAHDDYGDPTGREKELIQNLEEATVEIETLLAENEKLAKISNELRYELNVIKGQRTSQQPSLRDDGEIREHEQKMLDAIMNDQSASCGSSLCSPRNDRLESEVTCIGRKPPMTNAAELRPSKTANTFRPTTASYIERKKQEIAKKKKKIAAEKAKIRNWNVKDRTTNPYL